MRCIAVSAVAAVLVAGCSFGGNDESSAFEDADFVVDLGRNDQPDRRYGVVGLTGERGGRTRVSIEFFDPTSPRQQAEIRGGNCTSINVAVSYRLSPLADGKSETVVDVPLGELRRRGYLVMVHEVAEEDRLGSFCGDLARSQPPSAAPVFD
jgi:hypothetical protein